MKKNLPEKDMQKLQEYSGWYLFTDSQKGFFIGEVVGTFIDDIADQVHRTNLLVKSDSQCLNDWMTHVSDTTVISNKYIICKLSNLTKALT